MARGGSKQAATSGALDRIGPYEVVEEIGRGGMGVVYLARQPSLDRLVAVKVLLGDDPQLAARLRREAATLGELQHPGIVAIHDVGEVGGRPYIAMAYCAGGSLGHAVRERGRLTPGEAVLALSVVAEALATLHGRGLVHRDVKPSNVLLTSSGDPCLADFGLAMGGDAPSITASGALLGTIGYTAPELILGEDASPASDAFALGVLGYQLLAGRAPFASAHVAAVVDAIRRGDRLPLADLAPDAPPRLVELVEELLDPEPGRRPADLRAWAAQVRSTASTTPISPASTPERSTAGTAQVGWAGRQQDLDEVRRSSRRRAVVVLGVAAAAVVAAVIGASLAGGDDGDPVAVISDAPTTTTASTAAEPAVTATTVLAVETAGDSSTLGRAVSLDADGAYEVTLTFANPTAGPLTISHTEVIPKSVAGDVTDLAFDVEPTQVVAADPVVVWTFELAAGDSLTITYRASVEPTDDPEARLATLEADRLAAVFAFASGQALPTADTTAEGSDGTTPTSTGTTRGPTPTSSGTTATTRPPETTATTAPPPATPTTPPATPTTESPTTICGGVFQCGN